MKKIIILSLAIMFASVAYAQRLDVTIGPLLDQRQARADMDVPRVKFVGFRGVSYSTSLFFNTQAKKTYTGFGFTGGAFSFAVLDDYLKYSGAKKLSSESMRESEKVNLHTFITINNKMYVFYSQKFTDRDEFSVYVNEVSPDMVLLGSPIIIQNYKNLKQYGNILDFSVSKNKKHLLITRIYDGKSKEKQRVACKVVNDSFTEIWNREFELENTDRELSLQSAEVDNSGNFYLLAEYTVRKMSEPVLYTYFWKTKSLKSHKVGLTQGENFGTSLELLNGEKAYTVGLNQQDKAMSYFINRVNPQTEALERLGSGAMPEDFYKSSQYRIFSTKHWRVNQMVSLANNTVVASIEAQLVEVRNGVPVAWDSYSTYVVAFKEDGSLKWSHTVQKKQQTLQQMVGHLLVPAGNNVMVLYNDHPENIAKKPEDKKIEGFIGLKHAMAVVQEIDDNGKVAKYPFTKDKSFENFALDFTHTSKIEGDLYYAGAIHMKSRFSAESRSVTFKVK